MRRLLRKLVQGGSGREMESNSLQSDFPLEKLPDDILQSVFVYVDGKTLARCLSVVCRRFKDITDLQVLWKIKCENKGIPIHYIQLPKMDYKKTFFCNPYNRNLLKNWNAEEGFDHWKITSNGGDRFCIQSDKCSGAEPVNTIAEPGLSKCWATSYQLCSKEQTISLLDEGCDAEVLDQQKPTIVVSDWTTARFDCSSEYSMRVILQDKDQRELFSIEKENRVAQWQGGHWTQIVEEINDYPSGVRFIKFIHSGKDSQFWAGHYGPKFTGASVQFHVT